MDFVGRAVTVARTKLGGTISSGTVRSYDASSGLFVVVFDGGDSEELGLSEVSAAISPAGEGGGIELGRKRKKRRRLPEPGNGNVVMSSLSDETLVETGGFSNGDREGNLGVGIGGNSNLKEIRTGETLERVSEANLVENEVEGLGNGLDLNAVFNLNLNDELSFVPERSLRKRGRIDLNLDANGDFDEALNSPVEMKRMGCKFDLNLDVVDDVKEDEDVCSNGTLTKVDLDINAKIVEKLENPEMDELVGSDEKLDNGFIVSGDEDLKPLDSHLVLGSNSVKDGDLIDVEVKDGVSEAAKTLIVNGQLDNLESSPIGQRSSRRKRKKLLDLDVEETPTQPVLRRSARRGSAKSRVSNNETPSSPPASAITEENLVSSARKELDKQSVGVVLLPQKLQLPPSSRNLDLSDMPILDVFSIYACLRSFSTLLFLSPFELEDFVGAIKCESPSSLFDNVHVAILRILRKHIEFLSAEGSVCASDCLRSINWDFLDVITWPVLMVEYFLIHDSELKPRFDISSLKLFKADYCQQPASVKVEILRCLCDDLIEVEATRSELNRRSLAAEPEMGSERNLKLHVNKKRRASVGVSSGSYLEDQVANETPDSNYDECCLCKMDGNLICCDGCPAAYHSRCVGVAGDNLPEGDWYCPECAVDRRKPWMKPGKSLRGAELLGIDPHGRLYFHSSGYLLVSESSDSESLFSYYHKDDLDMVIEVLKLSDFYYGDILVGIFKHWGDVSLNGRTRNIDSLYSMTPNMSMKGQSLAVSNTSVPLASDKTGIEEPGLGSDVLKSASMSETMPVTGSSLVTSEESAETTQTQTWSGIACDLNNPDKTQNQPAMDCPSTSSVDVRQGAKTESIASQGQSGFDYVNHYSFGRIASSIAEDLLDKRLEKVKDDLKLAEEEIMARQMRIIGKKYSKFCWSNIQNVSGDLQKEKCGWCFTCRATAEDAECMFFMYLGSVKESSISDVLSLDSMKSKKSHLTDISCQMLSIENRLSGLLLGPWLNPNHSKLWRRSAVKAFDIASVKHLLLMLESSISPLALSSEWLKHVDSDVSVGSASHIITSSARGKNAIGKKRPKGSDSEPGPTLNPNSGLGIFWWRGGRISRKVFNWKVLPRSMVSKAARQGGCTKVPGILYPENSEYSKRSRNVVWQAAVQTSTSAEQLAFQLRELDSNIKWDDIENTHPQPTLDKESKKSVRLFKKVIIRRKSVQGGLAKYLLDFGGKRRAIPDVVLKNGSIVDEASSEKKKYWLEESHLPLYLLKNFEEKRIARKSNDIKSGKIIEPGRAVKRLRQNKGFAYLSAKADRSENYQCGHCSKDVLISEAVSCQHCKGFFHKRHTKKSGGVILAKCKYTCHRCQNGKRVKIDTKKGKTGEKIKVKKSKIVAQTDSKPSNLKSGKIETRGRKPKPKGKLKNKKKVIPVVPLRRSTRKAKCLVLQKKKQRGRKKAKPVKVKKATTEKVKKETTEEKVNKVISCKKKRTRTSSSYWLNGLHFSRKPNDERVLIFRSKRFLVPSEQSSADSNEPKCLLCDEAGHTSTLNYVGCEICEEWFHADAIGVHSDNIDSLIGFRCHTCCERDPPVCPHLVIMKFKSDISQLPEIQNDTVAECAEEVSNAVQPLSELQVACS